MKICVQPDQAADYWRLNVATNPYFNPDCECFVILMLNTRRRVRGHSACEHRHHGYDSVHRVMYSEPQ